MLLLMIVPLALRLAGELRDLDDDELRRRRAARIRRAMLTTPFATSVGVVVVTSHWTMNALLGVVAGERALAEQAEHEGVDRPG